MKLTHGTISAILNFVIGNSGNWIASDRTFYFGNEYKIYNPTKFPGWHPKGFSIDARGHYLCYFQDGAYPNYYYTPRSSQPLIRELLCGRPCKDSNGVEYKVANSIIADSNCIPLMMLLVNDRGERKVVVNSYCLKRNDIMSKVIIDTLVPYLVQNKYKEDLFPDPYEYMRSRSYSIVEICDLSDVWLDKFPTFDIDKKLVAEAANKFFTR